MSSIYLDPSLTIQKAASRARGDRLLKLRALCESQKTVSTRRLSLMIEELADSDRMDALHFQHMADFMRLHQRAKGSVDRRCDERQ